MNLYDFDGTVYRGDSSVDFYRYALKKHPLLLRYACRQLAGAFLYALGLIPLTRFKSWFFSFLRGMTDAQAEVRAFWDEKQGGIQEWYRAQAHPDDVVITASPEFLVRPMCERMGVTRVIGSDVDIETGAWRSDNNKGAQKVTRLFAAFPGAVVDRFYSDSLSDAPLAQLAAQAYFVRGETVVPWGEAQESRRR